MFIALFGRYDEHEAETVASKLNNLNSEHLNGEVEPVTTKDKVDTETKLPDEPSQNPSEKPSER